MMFRLKNLRHERNIKQKEIANYLGLTIQAISAYENPNKSNEPNFETLVKISKFFGVTTDYILGVDEYEGDTYSAVTKTILQRDNRIKELEEKLEKIKQIL